MKRGLVVTGIGFVAVAVTLGIHPQLAEPNESRKLARSTEEESPRRRSAREHTTST